MKRISVIIVACAVGAAAVAAFAFRHVGSSQRRIESAQAPSGSIANTSVQTDDPIDPEAPTLSSAGGVKQTASTSSSTKERSTARSELQTAADLTLAAFMDARMLRSAAAAEPFLSAAAYDQICDDPWCIRLIGVSNPHYVSWEVLSSTDEGEGTVLFVVRIHEEYTGEEESFQSDESIEIGPGQNYLGQPMDAVVIRVDQ